MYYYLIKIVYIKILSLYFFSKTTQGALDHKRKIFIVWAK